MERVSVTLSELKDLLLRFAWERRGWPREDAQRDFGALILYVMQQADRLGIDLVTAGEAHLSERSATLPALVPPRRDLDA